MSRSLVRCFWAVRPPDENLEQVGQLVRLIKRPVADLGLKVAWVAPESYHLTLKFLGDVAQECLGEMISRVSAELDRRKQTVAPRLTLQGLGAFPGLPRPQVLFVDTDGTSAAAPSRTGVATEQAAGAPAAGAAPHASLVALQAELARWLEPLGHAPDSRPFHPHLTLGRVRSSTAEQEAERRTALPELFARHTGFTAGPPFAATELILYESESSPAGPKYTPLVRLPIASALPRGGAAG